MNNSFPSDAATPRLRKKPNRRKSILILGLILVAGVIIGGILTTRVSAATLPKLKKIRGWHNDDFSSIVLQFSRKIQHDDPIIKDNNVLVRIKDVQTKLKPYRKYESLGSWVRLEKEDRDLDVTIGLPRDFKELDSYHLKRPYRLVIRLYKGKVPSEAPPNKAANESPEPQVSSNPKAIEDLEPLEESNPVPQSAALVETEAVVKEENLKPAITSPEIPKGLSEMPDQGLLTLNFYQSDIQEVLSALAMEREINIATAQDVSGSVSVHLYEVSLDEALDAITLAGGFRFKKTGGLYYVYKPKETIDPQADRIQMRIFKFKYADMDKIKEILGGIKGLRPIQIHEASKTIIVEDTPENLKKIEMIFQHWDQKPKQVLIEAKILEVTLTDDMSFGINWEALLSDVRLGTGGFSTATIPTSEPAPSPIPSTGTGLFGNIIAAAGTARQFTAAIDLLQTQTNVNTLSTPKILAIHGKPAKVQVGGQQGYRVTTTNVGVATETIEFIDTGTILDITPFVNDDGSILLEVKPEINSASLQGGIPVVSSTIVSTSLMARDGETVFIGGLIRDTKSKTREGLPCFGSIPGLGPFFGRNVQNLGKTELIVLITPTLFDGEHRPAEMEHIEKTKKIDKDFKTEPRPTHSRQWDFLSPVH